MTGYDVQSTVILELILESFEQLPAPVQMRPEGKDDLEMAWIDPGTALRRQHFYQIKKATEGDPKAEWSVADVARHLLGDAVAKLASNDAEQHWILGDKLSADVQKLLAAGLDAPQKERGTYLVALHRLAKAETEVTSESKGKTKHLLDHWNPTSAAAALDADVDQMVQGFTTLATDVPAVRIDAYRKRVKDLHALLPNVLSRIRARSYFGTEQQVADRVRARLVAQYKLDPDSVRSVIFRNLRGFINDVSKEPGRTITREEFERELVEVWPRLVATTQPRPLDADHVRRPQLIETLRQKVLAHEVIGPSGSGKSTLASEAYEDLSVTFPDAVVLFAEVRSSTSLQDVLVGVAYSLHRRGVAQLIGPALNLRATDTARIEQVAGALVSLTRDVLLLMDIADREANLEFQRDLAVFTRALRGTRFHLFTFSQASVFRELTEIERGALQIHRQPMPGLHFGEFWAMVERRHPGIDRSAAYNVFEQLTAGLSSGLLPNLAVELARTKSLAEMRAIAAKPPEHRLNAAHQARFYSLPQGLQSAAARVVCLSLPLAAGELITLFPQEHMKAALASLVQEGLLPPYEDRVEMHESVRSGLESLVAPGLAKETHETLSRYFEQRGMLPARIHHLERAGHGADAQQLARERFLAGEDWPDLVEYVGARKCVTDQEVLHLLLEGRHERDYLLSDLLPQVQTPETVQHLLNAIRSDPARYDRDYQRTWRLQEALLKCDPTTLIALVVFALELSGSRTEHAYVGSLLTCAWRAGVAADATFVEWFRGQPVEQQKKAVGFLLLRPELSRLQEALGFMQQHGLPVRSRRGHFLDAPILDLTTKSEIESFLAALPHMEPSQMLIARSALLEPFDGFIWQEREALRLQCRELLVQATAPEHVLISAIRILIYLNEREVVPLTRSFREGEGQLAALAWMAPAILDVKEEIPALEATALSPDVKSQSRVMAMAVASHLGADLGRLLPQAIEANPSEKRGFAFLLMMQASFAPFPEVVPLLSAELDTDDPKRHELLGAALMRAVEASFPGSEQLLLKALRGTSSRLLMAALMALGQRRLGMALEPLLEFMRASNSTELRAMALPAAMASGPRSTEPFRDLWDKAPQAAHWRWVLAGRLRDVGEAPGLITQATDRNQDWKARRIAILSASRLPFPAALKAIAPAVLQEPVSLPDQSLNFSSHMLLSGLVEAAGVEDLYRFFVRGRDRFVQMFAPHYEEWERDLLDGRGVLPAVVAIGWLWDRLEAQGFRANPSGLRFVQNELHVPLLQAAVLRGLRLQGCHSELFAAYAQATHDWLRIRAFSELCRGEPLSADEEQQAEELVRNAPPSIQFTLRRVFDWRPGQKPPKPPPLSAGTPTPPPTVRMNYAQARAFLKSSDRVDPSKAIVLELTEEELRELATELDPQRDTHWLSPADSKPARVSLSENGWRMRGGSALEPVSPHYEQRSALRPAVAAANRFGIDIPWHCSQLTSELRNLYADRFFASLGAQNDRERFLVELTENAEFLVPFLESDQRVRQILGLIDERVLPLLGRYLQSGPMAFFQQLCTLICQVQTPAVRPILVAAFRRWLVLQGAYQSNPARGQPKDPKRQVVWQTFSLLKEHPHFSSIPQVTERLLEVLNRSQLSFWNRRTLLELLKEQPAAYMQFEAEVIHSEVFEHHFDDEVDTYDQTADVLFRRVQ